TDSHLVFSRRAHASASLHRPWRAHASAFFFLRRAYAGARDPAPAIAAGVSMPIVWSFPTRILFGEGTVAEAGPEARRLGGRKALIVTDAGVREEGIADEVSRALEKAGVLSAIFDAVSTNPTEAEANAAAKAFTEAKADIVVGV